MDRPERDDMRAADYVLGLMAPKETAFFERDMRKDPELARQVEGWRARAANPDDADDADDTPHAAMRRRIVAGLNAPSRPAAQPAASPANQAVRAALAVAGLAAAALLLEIIP